MKKFQGKGQWTFLIQMHRVNDIWEWTAQFNISLIILGPDCDRDTHSCHRRELHIRVLVKGYKRKKKEKKKRRKKKKQCSSQVRSRSSSSRRTRSSRINTCRGWEESSWILVGWGRGGGLLRFLTETKTGQMLQPLFS